MAVRALTISSSFAKELLKLVFWERWENFGLKKDKNRSETVDCSLFRLQGMTWSFFHFIKRIFTNQRHSSSRVIQEITGVYNLSQLAVSFSCSFFVQKCLTAKAVIYIENAIYISLALSRLIPES